MKFNRFIFNLYLESEDGKKALLAWKNFFPNPSKNNPYTKDILDLINLNLIDKFDFAYFDEILLATSEGLNYYYQEVEPPKKIKYDILPDKVIFKETQIIWDEIQKEIKPEEYRDALEEIPFWSLFLTSICPQFFFPYFFIGHFYLLEKLFEEFDIFLPPPPTQKKYKERFNYYYDICEAMYLFRKEHNFTFEEFFVFMYGFSGNTLQIITHEIPDPTGIWISAGSPEDLKGIKQDPVSSKRWAANIKAKPGDLQLLYIWSPVSSIVGFCTVVSPGYYNPFDYWCHRAIVQDFQLFDTPISFHTLKTDPTWKEKHIVKMNMQGTKDQSVSYKEYTQLKTLLAKSDSLPKIKKIQLVIGKEKVLNEKDVEIKLLEPLLSKLGFHGTDYVRQLPLRMGRGERVYPDYALLANKQKKGEETAKFLWEAKYKIPNEEILHDSFLQAKSYAKRLSSKGFGLISCEGVWLFLEADNFNFSKSYFYTWNDVKKIDKFNELKDKCSRQVL